MWTAVHESCEARVLLRRRLGAAAFELWNANQVMRSGRPISGNTWAAVQHGLTELLISPAAKRRAAIELRPPGPDEDAVAAVSMLGAYKRKLKPVAEHPAR
jgi:hypothetical protein